MAFTESQSRDTYYCTPAEIKEITNIEKDVPDAKITFMQQHAEIFHINPILGSDLVASVKQELYNSHTGGTISSGTTALLEYIKYAEAYAVWYELIPMISFKTTRGGIMSMTPNNAQGVDLDQIVFLRKNVEELMSAYKQRLKDFLDDNAASYPDYEASCSGDFYSKNNSSGFLFY